MVQRQEFYVFLADVEYIDLVELRFRRGFKEGTLCRTISTMRHELSTGLTPAVSEGGGPRHDRQRPSLEVRHWCA